MNPLSEMSFEEWTKYKLEQRKNRTRNAEQISYDEPLYDLAFAVNEVCFDGKLDFCVVRLFYIPDEQQYRKAQGIFIPFYIMIDKAFYQEHGTDDETAAVLFHELIHADCYSLVKSKEIKDTENGYHTKAFADACEAHGGFSLFNGSETGYNKTGLTAETLEKIRKQIEKQQRHRGGMYQDKR